jgi:uncharacterized integral membrane protein
MKLIFWIVFFVIAVVVIAFSVTNRDVVTVDLWPSPYSVDLPVFGVAVVGIFVGFIWGGIISWVYGGKTRQRVRNLYRRAESDKREMAILRKKLAKLDGSDKVPALEPPKADAA